MTITEWYNEATVMKKLTLLTPRWILALWARQTIFIISAIYFMEFFDRDQMFCLIDVVDNLKGNILEGKWIAFKVSLVGKNKGIFELLMINQKKLWKIWWAKRKKGTLKSCCPFYQKKLQTITIWRTDTQKESCSRVTN